MNNLSIAIPTYNSSKYLEDIFKVLSRFKSIVEVIISDDLSDKKNLILLEKIVHEYKNKLNIKIYQNEKNLGGFKNKYMATSLCSNDYIYQLDSDNIPVLNSLNVISNFINSNKFNKETLYLPSKLQTFNKNKISSLFKKKNYITFSDKNLILDKKLILENLNGEKDSIKDKSIRWVLNVGNPLFYKKAYLEKLEEGVFQNNINISAADAIALNYYWIKNGGSIELLKNFKHLHRLRDDSYYVSEGAQSTESINLYVENFKKLRS